MRERVTAVVDLTVPSFRVADETVKAVNKAADEVCKLMPPERRHSLSGTCEEFRGKRLHHEYVLSGSQSYRIVNWSNINRNYFRGDFSQRTKLDNAPPMMESIFAVLAIGNDESNSRVLSSPVSCGMVCSNGDWYCHYPCHYYFSLTPENIRKFVHDIKSGRLVRELKKAVALAEAKEAAEVKLYERLKRKHEREQARIVASLA